MCSPEGDGGEGQSMPGPGWAQAQGDLARFALWLVTGAAPYLNRLKMAMATRRVARDRP